MRPAIITVFVWLALISFARATSVELPVTPTNLDTYFFTFSVLTNATNDGVAFHVTVTSKQFDIYPDSSLNVDKIIRKKFAGGGMERSIGPMTPAIPVTSNNGKRQWTADFAVSRKMLKDPDTYFVFSVLAHRTVNGKIIAMPSETFYELRLQDFAEP